ncbi:unnamed protein product [Camellia sinensis]
MTKSLYSPDGDIKDLLYRIIRYWAAYPILVQFWAPITTKEGLSFLATRNQSFSLTNHSLGLCKYRMISMAYKFDIDLGGETSEQHIGLSGRVFKHQFPESTPNVEYYSITEYPQCDDALRCGVRQSLAFSVSESSTQRCVGVIEVVSATGNDYLIDPRYCWYQIYECFEKKGLKCAIGFDHSDVESDEDENEARTIGLDEIKNVLKMVCDVHDLPCAQACVPCKLDGTRLSLSENCTGNDVYVLEFFMPTSNNANEDPRTSLRKILETMRKNFRCLRVASREELGVEEFSFQNGEKLDPVQIPQTTISLPQLELSQNEVEVMQVDSLDQQLVNAINTGSNVGGTELNNFVITCTQEKSTVKVSQRKGNKSRGIVKTSKRDGNNIGVKIKIPIEDILQNSELSLENAAKSLKVSKSTLKRVCRPDGIERWPPREINKVGCSQLNESAPCVNSDHLPSTQSSATIVHTEPHDTTMQDANIVTIKAKYGEGITMKFRMSLSSRFVQLQQEVAKRLNLKARTYYVKYEDEDGELILIGCDEDLQDYMRDSRSLGRSSIVVLLEQKLPIIDSQ